MVFCSQCPHIQSIHNQLLHSVFLVVSCTGFRTRFASFTVASKNKIIRHESFDKIESKLVGKNLDPDHRFKLIAILKAILPGGS